MPRAQFASTHVLPIEHQVVHSDAAIAGGRKYGNPFAILAGDVPNIRKSDYSLAKLLTHCINSQHNFADFITLLTWTAPASHAELSR